MSAYSYWQSNGEASREAFNGRLNDDLWWASGAAENYDFTGSWLQVDFLSSVVVTAIQTQGTGHILQWVTTYKLQYGTDVNSLTYYMSENTVAVSRLLYLAYKPPNNSL